MPPASYILDLSIKDVSLWCGQVTSVLRGRLVRLDTYITYVEPKRSHVSICINFLIYKNSRLTFTSLNRLMKRGPSRSSSIRLKRARQCHVTLHAFIHIKQASDMSYKSTNLQTSTHTYSQSNKNIMPEPNQKRRTFSGLTTLFLPDKGVQAWREKVALCFIILAANLCFLGIGGLILRRLYLIGLLTCGTPTTNKDWNSDEYWYEIMTSFTIMFLIVVILGVQCISSLIYLLRCKRSFLIDLVLELVLLPATWINLVVYSSLKFTYKSIARLLCKYHSGNPLSKLALSYQGLCERQATKYKATRRCEATPTNRVAASTILTPTTATNTINPFYRQLPDLSALENAVEEASDNR